MNRLYIVLGGLLILGGVAALIGQAWGLATILLVIGLAVLATEFRTNRKHGYVPLESGPDVGLERAKAQGLQNAQWGSGRPLPDPPRSTNGG
jgi:hypothetical protein